MSCFFHAAINAAAAASGVGWGAGGTATVVVVDAVVVVVAGAKVVVGPATFPPLVQPARPTTMTDAATDNPSRQRRGSESMAVIVSGACGKGQ